VLVEGPYGRLHPGVRTQPKLLLIGAGIGITPLRSILEGLDPQARDVVVLHRARDAEQLVLSSELSALTRQRGGRYITVTGPRVPGRSTWLPAAAAHLTDAQGLAHLVPDVAERDVFLCGAPGWMTAARQAALDCGVPADHVHLERFEY
jgi:ferredoxin-NADP reductase